MAGMNKLLMNIKKRATTGIIHCSNQVKRVIKL